MVISTVKSNNITNTTANPIVVLDGKTRRLTSIIDQRAVATTSLDEVGDKVIFGPIESNDRILGVYIKNDDLDSNGTPLLSVDFGLVYSGVGGKQLKNGNKEGATIDVDCFSAANTSLRAPNTSWVDVTNGALDIINIGKEAWEIGGLASDPGGLFYVVMNVAAVAGTAAAGDVVLRVDVLRN